jgi:hypothetical protein
MPHFLQRDRTKKNSAKRTSLEHYYIRFVLRPAMHLPIVWQWFPACRDFSVSLQGELQTEESTTASFPKSTPERSSNSDKLFDLPKNGPHQIAGGT